MRTITENQFNRLIVQAEEAEKQKITKIASNLTKQIEKASVRPDDASYLYAESSLKEDVESCLWDAALRIADFHNTTVDAVEIQGVIEAYSQHLIREIQVKANCEHGIGAYEPTVPGEERETVALEIEE